jgi:two-component system, NarL family, nitrate/nitrite response regulator NarL
MWQFAIFRQAIRPRRSEIFTKRYTSLQKFTSVLWLGGHCGSGKPEAMGGYGLELQDLLRAPQSSAIDDRDPRTARSEFAEPARRHLAIVDQSRLRRDCFKLALGQQPRRWRITDVPLASDLVRLMRNGEAFAVILLGASTCGHIDLIDLALLAGAAPQTPILVAADCDDPERARAILRSGARGFLPMSLGLKVLVAALERVRAGGSYVPLALSEPGLADAAPPATPPAWQELTRRQRDVLALISEGRSNKLIADALSMSESTVKAHVKQIIRRLHVANRTQAALLATGARRQPDPITVRRVERVL